MSSCQCSLESGDPWSQGLDLSLLLPVISLIFTVVSKLLLLYSTIDKTSRLKIKSFSTVRFTQRGSQCYMEKRRGLSRLDLGIASLHMPCIKPGSRKENTAALVKVMENPYVDIIGHPGDPRYDIDYKEVFRQAKATGTILEINNASLIPGGFRDGSQENVKEILRMSMEEGISVVLGSDAHFYMGIGDFSYALALMKEVGFPEELVLNTDPVRFLASLKKR